MGSPSTASGTSQRRGIPLTRDTSCFSIRFDRNCPNHSNQRKNILAGNDRQSTGDRCRPVGLGCAKSFAQSSVAGGTNYSECRIRAEKFRNTYIHPDWPYMFRVRLCRPARKTHRRLMLARRGSCLGATPHRTGVELSCYAIFETETVWRPFQEVNQFPDRVFVFVVVVVVFF